jgi:hypothetical protein
MRTIKQLPQVLIEPEDYAFLRDTCARLLAGARRVAGDGTPVYFPDTSGCYPALWTRDFCYLAEYAGDLLPAAELLAGIDFLLAGQRGDGVVPDRVTLDGTPVYLAGPQDTPLGTAPPADNPAFLVKLLDAYYLRTGDVAGWFQRLPALLAALETVPLSPDGLVYIDPNSPSPAYGFADTVAATGKVFLASLLHWEAARRLAVRLQELEDHEEARIWYDASEAALKVLPELYDEEALLYWAASEDCRQHDLWGSVYAAVIRIASKRQSRLIGDLLVEQGEMFFQHGHLRHLPKGEYWERLLAPVPAETYQNGAYWAVPVGWAAQTLALEHPAEAEALIGEVLSVWREGEVYECLSPYADPRCPGHLTGAVCLLGAVRPR